MKSWNDLPKELKNEEVEKYYSILKRKTISISVKRLFDIIVSFLMLIVLSPIFFIIAICIKADSKGPVFYRQVRISIYSRPFRIFKFRTMVVNADRIGALVTTKDDQRITKVGNKIRKYRLDEIPQVINVLLGDMSFVGTRPEVEKYTSKYTDEMKATLLMRPGITSLASINFKDEDELLTKYTHDGQSIDDVYLSKVLPLKMKYNLDYIKKFGFIGDVKIMIDTVIAIFK